MKKEQSHFNYCTSENFKTDISELCDKCPLIEKINKGIKDQIVFKATEQQSILSKEQFQDYIKTEILNAQKAMQTAILENQRRATYNLDNSKDDYLKNRIELYIWNKERIKALNNLKTFSPQQIAESQFSVLEWATIFYYADETKLLPKSKTLKERIEQFINKYRINTTFNYFRTQYYNAKKRINKKNDYPIDKLELIIPFLKKNYNQTVTKVENDIKFLEEEKAD